MRARLVAVTHRRLIAGAQSNQRGKESVHWTGFREAIKYETFGSSPLLHRRVVFATTTSIDLAAFSYTQAGVPVRDQLVDPRVWGAEVCESLFGKVKVEDWSNEFVAKLNKQNIEVLNDQNRVVKSAGSGQVYNEVWWQPLGKKMVYGDAGGVGRSPWATITSDLGNVYVLDIFVNRESDSDVGAASVSSELTVYWRE